MAVCKMQRMNIFGLQQDRKAILERLQSWGVLEVNIPEKDREALHTMDTQNARQRFQRQVQTLQQALEVLDRYAPEKKSLLSMLEGKDPISPADFSSSGEKREEILSHARDILAADKERAEKKATIARLEAQIEALQPWMTLDVPLDLRGTAKTRLLLGTLPAAATQESVLTAVAQALPELPAPDLTLLSRDKDCSYFAAICLKEDAPALEEALRGIGFTKPTQTGDKTPAAMQEMYCSQIRALQQEESALAERLTAASQYRQSLQVLSDYFRIRADKYEVLGQLPQSSRTFLVSGYVPADKTAALSEDLERACHAAVEIEDLPEEEEAPVLLKNNAFGATTEGVLKSFGLPGKGEIDPSFLTACFYVFLFGLMLSDAAYGLIVSLVTGICLLKFPRMADSMKKSLQLFFWCGISTLFWGIMFGGYFGDAVDVVTRTFFGRQITVKALWFFPLNDPTKLLVYSMLFGLIHLMTGLGIKGYMCLRDKNYMGFIFDVLSWYFLLFGLIIMLLPTELFYGISRMEFNFSPGLVTAGKVLAIGGAAGIVLMSARDKKNPILRVALGAYDLYNITSWLSDILSYSRLLALGLATGVIAQVINQMGSMMGGGFVGAVVFILVFLVGHILNLLINLLGAYVHTCRLQYVEFYGKFYEGGGREFAPFKRNTQYVTIEEEN